nr:hypothetical protein [Tanacetum cinerariifolium]
MLFDSYSAVTQFRGVTDWYSEENLGDLIEIRVDVVHLTPVDVVVFPATTVVRTLAQHGKAIRGIQEHLLGVPIQEELTALRFKTPLHSHVSCREDHRHTFQSYQTLRETSSRITKPTPKSVGTLLSSHHFHKNVPRHTVSGVLTNCLDMGFPP